MDIRTLEAKTGLPRANIRFYEKEGLITPVRKANGYRDYSEEDRKNLMRIQLLRKLHFTVEEIRKLQDEDPKLKGTLEKRIRELEQEKSVLSNAVEICYRISNEDIRYSELETMQYLHFLESNPEKRINEKYEPVDEIRIEPHPYKRLFARLLDEKLYLVFIYLIFRVGFSMLLEGWFWYIAILLMINLFTIVIEPLSIAAFGATPGKWILGIRIYHRAGRHLTYRESVRRTFQVMAQGVFFYIPILHLFQMYLRYRDYRSNNWPDWDDTVDYVVLKYRGYRLLVGAICWILYLIFSIGSHLYAFLPAHKGMISKAEFIENYNELALNYGTDQRLFFGKYQNNVFWYSQRLDESGRSSYRRMDGSEPRFTFIEENGVLREVIVTMETTVDSMDAGDEVVHAAAALLGAQPEAFWEGGLHGIIDTLEPYAEKEFQITYCGVELTCEIEARGYQLVEDTPWPHWEFIGIVENPGFKLVMTMRITE